MSNVTAAQEMTTTENARFIEKRTASAVKKIHEAMLELRAAEIAINKGENEADLKLPNFEDLRGLLKIGSREARRLHTEWAGYADARAERR